MFYPTREVIEFEFLYLVELTRQKMKPLSRWEKPLPEQVYHWLRQQGMYVEKIPRKTVSGMEVVETIFSTSRNYTDFYLRKLSNTSISSSAEIQKLEGFLFGYPSCCVQQFIRHPYAPNSLSRDTQSLLFHWVCESCRSTAGLVPYYQSLHKLVLDRYQQQFPKRKRIKSARKSICKALAALLIVGSCLSAQTISENIHYIPLAVDVNENGLSYAEEIYLGAYDAGALSENCQIFAKLFKTIIDSLPDTIQANRTYKLNHYLRGVVLCPKCGSSVNMGFVALINPLRKLQLDIPFLGIHFMEHGFFSYGSEVDFRRVEIDTLKKILFPYDIRHLLPVEGDTDKDGLADVEEDSLWWGDTKEDPDLNLNGVPDGVEIAEELINLFPKLEDQADGVHSSIEKKPVYGLENCLVCGSTHNMGCIEIRNPENQRTCQIPYITLHAMAHGSFSFNGTVHQNQRTDVINLYRTMKTHMLFVPDDTDNDGLQDAEEKYFGFDHYKADSDDNGICDGKELALSLVERMESLPITPGLYEPYIEYLDMYGTQLCAVCGKKIPMGVLKICNPLINTPPFELPYYAYHFLKHSSFAFEGAETGRISPKILSDFLDYPTNIPLDQETSLPRNFELKQNYPNPFNPQTVIPYYLSEKSKVSLKIYDICGHEIKTLLMDTQTPGFKSIVWDGTTNDNRNVGSGFFIYKLTVDGKSQSRLMLYVK